MVRKLSLSFVLLGLVGFVNSGQAAQKVGDIVTNISLPYHTNTAKQFHLYDFPGKVLLLEFFWAGCPFCQGAAPYLESGIVDYYRNQGGNADGVPVQLVGMLVFDEGQTTENFIQTYGLDLVVNDLSQTAYSQLGGAGTPHFVVINSVSNSPTHAAWQIVAIDTDGFPRASDSQYASKATQRINTLRGYIDSVRAANLPPQLLHAEILDDGRFRFVLDGQIGRTNRIESTTDWNTWTFITNLVNQTGSVIVIDPGAIGFDQRFYRALVQ